MGSLYRLGSQRCGVGVLGLPIGDLSGVCVVGGTVALIELGGLSGFVGGVGVGSVAVVGGDLSLASDVAGLSECEPQRSLGTGDERIDSGFCDALSLGRISGTFGTCRSEERNRLVELAQLVDGLA